METKIRLVAVCIAVSIMMCACGNVPSNSDFIETEAVTEITTEIPTEVTTEEPTIVTTEAPTETPTETNAPKVTLGTIEDGEYKNMYADFAGPLMNGFLGFGCEFDEQWKIYSAEGLQELPDHVKAVLEGSDWEGTASQTEQFWDMQAENVSELTTVNVMYTGLGTNYSSFKYVNEDRGIEMVLAQESALVAVMENAGYTDIKIEKVSVNFLGEEHAAIKTYAKMQGVDYYTLQVFDYNSGPYSVTLTAASFIEDKTQDVLDMFYSVRAFEPNEDI